MQSTEDALADLSDGLSNLAARLHVMSEELYANKSNATAEFLASLRRRLDAKRKYLESASMTLRFCLYRDRWQRFAKRIFG